MAEMMVPALPARNQGKINLSTPNINFSICENRWLVLSIRSTQIITQV